MIVAVAHKEFKELGLEGIQKLFRDGTGKVLIDVKGLYRIEELNQTDLVWWRL